MKWTETPMDMTRYVTYRNKTLTALTLLAWCISGAIAAENSITVIAKPPDNSGADAFPTQTSSASKTKTSLREIPQSVSVISRKQMDQMDAHSLNEALRYTPGVSTEQRGALTAFDQYTIRGFNSGGNDVGDLFLDGLRLNNGQIYGMQQIDPFLLEQIDVIRGPSSVLYGLANPGGVVAMTSKLPGYDNIRRFELESGNHNYQRGSFDIGGMADDRGSLLYRVAGTATTQHGQPRDTRIKRYAIAPSVTYIPDEQNNLTLYGRLQNDPQMSPLTSLPVQGTAKYSPYGKLPVDGFPGEPDYNRFQRKQRAVGYSYEHFFNDRWSVKLNGRYAGVTTDYSAVIFTKLQQDQRTISRSARRSDERFNTLNFDNQLLGEIDTGQVNHHLLFGINWDRFTGNAKMSTGTASDLDIYAPAYGHEVIGRLIPNQDNRMVNTQTGLYAQDQLSYQDWRVTLGLRHDRSEINSKNNLRPGADQNSKQRDSATTVRVGTNYLFSNGLSPYFTYAQSFQPVNKTDFSGNPFTPSRGELYETGLKYQPDDSSLFLSAALFNLTQDKVLTNDPLHDRFSVQDGKIRSNGLELEAKGQLTEQFSVMGAYTLQQVKYIQNSDPEIKGKRPLHVPTQIASLWINWESPTSAATAGLGGGIGGRFNKGNLGGTLDNEFKTGGYGIVDAEVHYDLEKLLPAMRGTRVQLTAHNLFNREYVSSCFSESQGCFYAAERSVIGKISYAF